MNYITFLLSKFWYWICERQKRHALESMLHDELEKIQEILSNVSNSIVSSTDFLLERIDINENHWTLYDKNKQNLYLIQDKKRKLIIKCYNEIVSNCNQVYNVHNKIFETFEKHENIKVRNAMSVYHEANEKARLHKGKAEVKKVAEENLKLISKTLAELSHS